MATARRRWRVGHFPVKQRAMWSSSSRGRNSTRDQDETPPSPVYAWVESLIPMARSLALLRGGVFQSFLLMRSVQKPRRPAGRRAVDKSPQTVASSRAINWSKKVENNHLIHVEVESHHLVSASSAWSCIFFRCPAAGGGARQALSLCLLSNLRPRAISYAIDRGPRAGRRTRDGHFIFIRAP